MVILFTTIISIFVSILLFISIEKLGGICKLAFILPIIFLLCVYATKPEYTVIKEKVYDSGMGKFVLFKNKSYPVSNQYMNGDEVNILIPNSNNPFYSVIIDDNKDSIR